MTMQFDISLLPTSAPVSSERVLYTPSAFARSSLLYLQEAGSLKALAPHTSSRKNLASYLCFIILEGTGELVYEGKQYKLNSGDCVFIDCRKTYSHSTTKDDLWSLQWVHFYGNSLPSIYDKYVERGGRLVFRPKDICSIQNIMRDLYLFASSSDYIRDMRINEKVGCLLTLLMEESWHPEISDTTSKHFELNEIKAYLDENYSRKISLDELAEKFFINKYYLTRIFKECMGITVNNYILSKRITASKQILRFSDKGMDEIGYETGFGDSQYFCRMFKKVEGITPGEYRKMW